MNASGRLRHGSVTAKGPTASPHLVRQEAALDDAADIVRDGQPAKLAAGAGLDGGKQCIEARRSRQNARGGPCHSRHAVRQPAYCGIQ